MECIKGKKSLHIDKKQAKELIGRYSEVHLDIGTGDGRYVMFVAKNYPSTFTIGIDACRDNLRRNSRLAPANALFVTAGAESLPEELRGSIDRFTILFPWGSLMQGLLAKGKIWDGIRESARPGAIVQIQINEGAFRESGLELISGGAMIETVLRQSGFNPRERETCQAIDMKTFPTTWSKRLAYGPYPRTLRINASLESSP